MGLLKRRRSGLNELGETQYQAGIEDGKILGWAMGHNSGYIEGVARLLKSIKDRLDKVTEENVNHWHFIIERCMDKILEDIE